MPGTDMGVLELGTLTTASLAWGGGRGILSLAGTEQGPGHAFVVILENENSGAGVWQPSGDVALRYVGDQIAFDLPAGNVRCRLNDADDTISVHPWIG